MWRIAAAALSLARAAASEPYTCELSCAAGDCSGQIRLPDDYSATIRWGEPTPDAAGLPASPDGSLEPLQRAGLLAYAKHPRARGGSPSPALGAKFHNFRETKLEMRWDDGSAEGVYSGNVNALSRTSTMTYHGHAFLFIEPRTRERVARLVMNSSRHLYIIEPDSDAVRRSKEYLDAKAEYEFMMDYLARSGTPWLSHYPRDPPVRRARARARAPFAAARSRPSVRAPRADPDDLAGGVRRAAALRHLTIRALPLRAARVRARRRGDRRARRRVRRPARLRVGEPALRV